MRFEHPDHPGRAVRLAPGLNLQAGDDLDAVVTGLDAVAAPLARRLSGGAPFGIGAYVPGPVAVPLAAEGEPGERRGRLLGRLREHGLQAFTFNAFPYGGFHDAGLKERVFRPTWRESDRMLFTASVAELAARAWREGRDRPAHVSVSTHAGMFGADVRSEADLDACADRLARAAWTLAQLEAETGCRVVLSLEAEPRSSSNDTAELAAFLGRVRARAPAELARLGLGWERAADVLARHLGACLDACHAAVEFENPQDAYLNATAEGAPLGKLQVSSAIELADPAANDAARERLLALDEPVFLHQVTGRLPGGLVRARDLPEVAAAYAADAPGWRACDAWRCHFHVPVDLETLGLPGLGTTRAYADELLRVALADPARWGSAELHVEVETYTWTVLPGEARGTGTLVDGLERELVHVRGVLAAAGWRPAATA